ncbi:MAG: hypothetical protein ABS34_11005 [Opitutaceae bacterium BACL24 MAG-120322-bin51]|jgi:hypothetical protein|nr:MAG: hypothetical protein ABS34_11005 [Opitutaceae bacterium BACL24 MAG-120322-bin51]
MSRIDQVMRELSDMRSFYLKLQASKRAQPSGESEAVAEAPADYNAEGSGDSLGSDASPAAGECCKSRRGGKS